MIRMYTFPQLLTPENRLALEPGGPAMTLSENKLLIWIDLMPTYRYAHPTRTVLVGAGEVDVLEGQWWIEVDGRRFADADGGTPAVLAPVALDGARVHVLPRIFMPGEALSDGKEAKIEIEEPSVVLWIDRKPEAKYVHDTRYVILGARRARVVDGRWWPEIGGRRVDTQLLPMACPQPWEIPDGRSQEPPPGERRPVEEVLLADVMPVRVAPQRGTVTAIGRVPTAGWTGVRLDPRVYIAAPDDDIIDFDLSALPPGGPAAQVQSEVCAAHQLPLADVAGVRIHGERNSLAVYIPMIRDNALTGDPFNIQSATLEGDQLVVKVRYGGGCRRHDFRVVWNGQLRKSNPPQLSLMLIHDSHADPCRALVYQTLRIDLFDLPPAVVHLNNGLGFEASFNYRLPAP